jgi:hypothetical protein
MTSRTVTRSIETDLSPEPILTVLTNPKHIPEWAPVFADTVEPTSANHYRLTKEGASFDMELVVSRDAGTVDHLREMGQGKRGGAYIRVFPRPGDGSVIVMMVPLAPGADPQSLAAILEQELATLVRISGT